MNTTRAVAISIQAVSPLLTLAAAKACCPGSTAARTSPAGMAIALWLNMALWLKMSRTDMCIFLFL